MDVKLYEDGAGGLYLVGDDGTTVGEIETSTQSFRVDAEAFEEWAPEQEKEQADINRVSISEWRIMTPGDYDDVRLIAEWVDGGVVVVGRPGHSAREYLGPDAPEVS